MTRIRPTLALFPLLLSLLCFAAKAHEVDQFSVPVGKKFTDHGPFWNDLLYSALEKGARKTNAQIELAERIPIPAIRSVRLAQLRSKDHVSWAVARHLPTALYIIEVMEAKIYEHDQQSENPNEILGHFASLTDGAYSYLNRYPDPRQFNRVSFMRCSTIKLHGTYMGTDKVGHFLSMGYLYYTMYRAARLAGTDHPKAMRVATTLGRHGFVSENWLVGAIPCGIYSNADMVSNYVGMKFYINLTEPVTLKGCKCPAMLALEDGRWKIQSHVQPRGDYFAMFVSDHLDEVLNPCIYDWGMRSGIRRAVRDRRGDLLDWYAGDDPRKRTPEHFNKLLEQYRTYYGEDYGHAGDDTNLITLANTCFESTSSETSKPPSVPSLLDPSGRYTRSLERQWAEIERVRAEEAVAPVLPLQDSSSRTAVAGTPGGKRAEIDVTTTGPRVCNLHDAGTYDVAVTNRSAQQIDDLCVVTRVPPGLQVTTLERPAEFQREANSLSWRVPKLDAGQTVHLRFKAKAIDRGEHVQLVVVYAEKKPLAGGMHTTRVGDLQQAPVVDYYAVPKRQPAVATARAQDSPAENADDQAVRR